jgi:hypothetical protein
MRGTPHLCEQETFKQPQPGRTRVSSLVHALTATVALAVAQIGAAQEAWKIPANFTGPQAAERTTSPAESETFANTYARKFPQKVSGISNINGEINPNAKHLLIHLRQIHWVDREMNPEILRKISSCQEELRMAIEELIKNDTTRLRAIYEEGRLKMKAVERIVPMVDVDAILAERSRPEEARALLPHTDAKKINREKFSISDLMTKGVAQYLKEKKNISLKPSEWPELKSLCNTALDERWENSDEFVCELREDALLEIIAIDETSVAYTVYGSAHDWRNNVREWNMRYPDKAFSLIEMTPETIGMEEGFDPSY